MTTTDETGSTGSTVLEEAVTSTDPTVLAKVWGFGGMTSVLLGAVAGLLVGLERLDLTSADLSAAPTRSSSSGRRTGSHSSCSACFQP